ncbi:uncharacterized protein LOC129739146 [Uranotaenia lowii]|uniref:uncharacterized protein LOC129739146 n=1 Tax=Uranotaenia lowii TaxID=190385 RepID=UPI002478935E|nr:uncharacterized protein LOC129739146 [Uranotaenia lowii]
MEKNKITDRPTVSHHPASASKKIRSSTSRDSVRSIKSTNEVTIQRPQRSTSQAQRSTTDTGGATPDSREERKANGRIVAVCVALFLIFLVLYHAWLRRTAIVAGVMVPVLIMLLYTAWVLYSARRHKRKMMLLRNAASLNSVNCIDKESTASTSGTSAYRTGKNNSHQQHHSSIRCSNINELSQGTGKGPSKDINVRKYELEKLRTASASNGKPLAKVLPRQQSSITPNSLKEFALQQQRRFSLDPTNPTLQSVLKAEFEKQRHHGSSGKIIDKADAKHGKKVTKSSKERIEATH